MRFNSIIHKKKTYFFLILLIGMTAQCKRELILSDWRSDSIFIDGDFSDWQDHLQTIDVSNFFLGVQNDSTHLYLCLISSDPTIIRQIRRSGLITWLTPFDNKKMKIGITFPVGMHEPEMLDKRLRRSMERNCEENRPHLLHPVPDKFEIMWPDGKEFQSYSFNELPELKCAFFSGMNMGGDMGSGRDGGFSGRFGRRSMGHSSEGRMDRKSMEPIKIQFKVQLAHSSQ